MKKHLLVFACTALFLSALIVVIGYSNFSKIADASVEPAYGNEMTFPDKGGGSIPLSSVSEIIYLRNEQPKTRTIKAWITQYTCVESSRNGVCINASGRRPVEGVSVACPRTIKLTTKVRINNLDYQCDDRTHSRFEGRFDIFVEDYQKALAWGKQWKEIKIYE